MGSRSRRYEHRDRHSSRRKSEHRSSERRSSRPSSAKKTKKIDASSHFSDLNKKKDTLQKTPLCVVAWIICTLLLTLIGLSILLYISTDNLTHTSSQRWTLDGSEIEDIAGKEITIEYSNLFGSIYFKEHTQGGEFIEIWREDSGNKDYIDFIDPEVIVTDTTATIRLNGPTLWEFVKAAGRKSEYTIYVPNYFADIKNITLKTVNGVIVVDLPTIETVDVLDITAYVDLNHVIGATQIMNGKFKTINAYTLKPHFCVGVSTDAPDYEHCFASIMRDMRVTSGVQVNNLKFDTFNGNFFAHNMSLLPGTTQDEVNESSWEASTLNGRVHFTWPQDASSFVYSIPPSLSANVTTTSWQLVNEEIILFEGPDGLFDGYTVDGPSVTVYPITALDTDTDCVKDCSLANHDSLDVDINGTALPPLPDPLNSRVIYMKAGLGTTMVRNLQ